MKIIFKILIPILTASLLVLSCSGDKPKSTDQTKKAPTTEQVLVDSKITLLEEGLTTAVIDAKYIEKRFGEKNTMAREITAYFYDSTGAMTSWLVADSGFVNEDENMLNVFGNVEVTSRDSVRLYTETLSWNQSMNSVVTEDYVEIHRGEDIIRGYGLVTDRNLKEYTIKKQVTGRIKNLPGKEEE
jgi:LPS export ABC transporter protein LptC